MLTIRGLEIKNANKISFRPINEDLVRGIVKELSTNKAASGDIPEKLLKESEYFFPYFLVN